MHMSLAATDMDRDVFRVVNDRYAQDLREFFTRSIFYLVAEGGLLSVFFARNVPHITSNLLNWGVVASGLVLALLWWLVAWVKQQFRQPLTRLLKPRLRRRRVKKSSNIIGQFTHQHSSPGIAVPGCGHRCLQPFQYLLHTLQAIFRFLGQQQIEQGLVLRDTLRQYRHRRLVVLDDDTHCIACPVRLLTG